MIIFVLWCIEEGKLSELLLLELQNAFWVMKEINDVLIQLICFLSQCVFACCCFICYQSFFIIFTLRLLLRCQNTWKIKYIMAFLSLCCHFILIVCKWMTEESRERVSDGCFCYLDFKLYVTSGHTVLCVSVNLPSTLFTPSINNSTCSQITYPLTFPKGQIRQLLQEAKDL